MYSFEQNEQKVRKQAIQIRQKLIQKKQIKQAEYQKQIKQQLIKEYQIKFDRFKKQIQQYSTSQLSSLDLIKQFRLGQITEFETKVGQSIRKLQLQEKQLLIKKEELENSLSQGIQFLQAQKQRQIRQKKQQVDLQLQRLVKQYQERIQIE